MYKILNLLSLVSISIRKVKNNILNMYHFFFYQYIFDSFNLTNNNFNNQKRLSLIIHMKKDFQTPIQFNNSNR